MTLKRAALNLETKRFNAILAHSYRHQEYEIRANIFLSPNLRRSKGECNISAFFK